MGMQVKTILHLISTLQKMLPKNKPLFSMAQAARVCGVSAPRFFDDLKAGLIPAPRKSKGAKRRYYTAPQVAKLKLWFGSVLRQNKIENRPSLAERRRRSGLFSLPDVARATGYSLLACQYDVAKGYIPAPTRLYPGYHSGSRFYDRPEFEAVVRRLRAHRRGKGGRW